MIRPSTQLLERPAIPTNEKIRILGFRLLLLFPIIALGNTVSLIVIGGLNIRPTDILFVVTLGVWVLAVSADRISGNEVRLILMVLALFALPALISIASSEYVVDWQRWMRFLQTLLWGIYAVSFVRSRSQWQRFSFAIALSGAMLAISSVYQYGLNPDLYRVAGFFGGSSGEEFDEQLSFNEVGALYALAIVSLYPKLLAQNVRRGPLILLLLLNIVGLILVQSRSAILGVIAFFLISTSADLMGDLFYRSRVRLRSMLTLLIPAVIGLAIVLSDEMFVFSRILRSVESYQSDISITTRLDLWEYGVLFMGDTDVISLIFGHGSDTFSRIIGGQTLDNFYMDHILQEGLIGLGLILATIYYPLFTIRLGKWFRRENLGILGAAILAAVVSLTGNTLVSPIYGALTMIVLWGSMSHGTSSEQGVV